MRYSTDATKAVNLDHVLDRAREAGVSGWRSDGEPYWDGWH